VACLELYFESVYIMEFDVDCFTVTKVVFMEGRNRECNVALLVLYCVTLYILLGGVKCVMVRNVVFIEVIARV